MSNGIARPAPNYPIRKLPASKELPKPPSFTSAYNFYLTVKQKFDEDPLQLGAKIYFKERSGFGYSDNAPIGYQAVLGVVRADEYFMSIVPDVGKNWRLNSFFRVGSHEKCIDEYVVMYSGNVDGVKTTHIYNLFLWMYDKAGFPYNLLGIYRVPNGFIPNPNYSECIDKTLYNKKHNLYGKNNHWVEKDTESSQNLDRDFEISSIKKEKTGTVLMSELAERPEDKNNILRNIPEVEGYYEVIIKLKDFPNIKFGKHKTINGKPFCPVVGNKKVYLKNPAELQASFDSNHSDVLYIGKADNLKRRITQLVNMAFGGTGHRGGIDIWAVQDYGKYLQIIWHELGDFNSAKEAERELLDRFKHKHNGNLPVANQR